MAKVEIDITLPAFTVEAEGALDLDWIEKNKLTTKFQKKVKSAWASYIIKLNSAYGVQYITNATQANVNYDKAFVPGESKTVVFKTRGYGKDLSLRGGIASKKIKAKVSRDNTSAARRSRMKQRGWYHRAGVLGQPSHISNPVVTEERLMLSKELYTTITSCRISFEGLKPGDFFDILTPADEDKYRALDLDVNGADRNFLLSKFLEEGGQGNAKFNFIHTPTPKGYDIGEEFYESARQRMIASLLEMQEKDKSKKSKKK